MLCPCGSTIERADCCEPYVRGTKPAPTAEALMRSRYTAYTMEEVDYIVQSHIEESRGDVDPKASEAWAKQADWLGLTIVDTVDGGKDDTEGVVEFIARFKMKGAEQAHHERSTFKKVGDHWFYVDGDMVKKKPVTRETPKVGRNEACPCGSGKKFKRCCG